MLKSKERGNLESSQKEEKNTCCLQRGNNKFWRRWNNSNNKITLREQWKDIFKDTERKQLPTYNFIVSQNVSQNEDDKTSPYAKLRQAQGIMRIYQKGTKPALKRLLLIESRTI